MDNILLKERTQIKFPEFKILEEGLKRTPSNELMVIPQIDSARHPIFNNDTGKSLYLLKKYGYAPSLFCAAKPQDHISGFEVQINNWVWDVKPVNPNNILTIPDVFLKGIGILLENSIKIDAAAIAKPKPQETFSNVLIEELSNGSKIPKEMVVFFIFGILSISVDAGRGIGSATTVPAEIPDPVLLIKIQDNWLEVGRWI